MKFIKKLFLSIITLLLVCTLLVPRSVQAFNKKQIVYQKK